jgi:serine phosphatase RsbU (regulator of sigma subunit)
MRLSFIGVSLSPELKSVLAKNAFSVDVLASPNKCKPKSADLIAYSLSQLKDLKAVTTLRESNPHAWIALVVDRKFFQKAQNDFIHCEDKNAVWLKEDWEEHFWLLFQQFLEARKLINRIEILEKENDTLTVHSQEMLEHSKKIVSRIERDVHLAENIHKKLLPQFVPNIPGLRVAAKYIPAAGLGGDYYDLFEFPDQKRLGVLLADSKTHGIAAALLTALLKLRMEEMKDRFPSAASFVEHLNKELAHTTESMSLFYGIFDRTTLQFQYASAGDIHPVHWRDGTSLSYPKLSNPPLGTADNFSFRDRTISLKPGDLILLHTDGLCAPLGAGPNDIQDKVLDVLHSKAALADPLQVQNEFLGRIDKFLEKSKLPDDVTLIHLLIDDRALYKVS